MPYNTATDSYDEQPEQESADARRVEAIFLLLRSCMLKLEAAAGRALIEKKNFGVLDSDKFMHYAAEFDLSTLCKKE